MTTAFISECEVYSSNTPSGNATTSTSHGAWRRTWSTVGEKNRDCLRQRGEEPSTIRSALRRVASSTIDMTDRPCVDGLRPYVDPVLLTERLASATDASAWSATAAGSGACSSRSRGTWTTVIASTPPALLREGDGRRDHLLADVAELHGDEDAPERRADGEGASRVDVLEHPLAFAQPGPREDDETEGEPGGPRVARSRVGHHREHEDRRSQRRPDERGQRHVHAPDAHVGSRAEGSRRSGSSRRSRITASCAR